MDSFEFEINKNIFKSVGLVKIEDKLDNLYEFSQVYIDTKKKEILGTDIKAFLNDESFKINKKNKPRVFANAIKISKNKSMFGKSIFTICDYRKKTNALHGQSKLVKCFTIVRKKQFTMIML